MSFRVSPQTGAGIPETRGDCHTSVRTGSQWHWVDGRPTNSVYQIGCGNVNKFLCIKPWFCKMHDYELFSLYNIPAWKWKMDMLLYGYKENCLKPFSGGCKTESQDANNVKAVSFMRWSWTMRKLSTCSTEESESAFHRRFFFRTDDVMIFSWQEQDVSGCWMELVIWMGSKIETSAAHLTSWAGRSHSTKLGGKSIESEVNQWC